MRLRYLRPAAPRRHEVHESSGPAERCRCMKRPAGLHCSPAQSSAAICRYLPACRPLQRFVAILSTILARKTRHMSSIAQYCSSVSISLKSERKGNIFLPSRALSSKPAVRCCCSRMMGQRDGRTDGRTCDRYIDPARHTMQAVSIKG